MSINFRTVSILAALSTALLAGCNPPKSDYKAKLQQPDFSKIEHDAADVDKILAQINAMKMCNKPEDQLEHFDEASQNPILVTGEVDIQDTETTDCNGKVAKSREVFNEKLKPLLIEPPENLSAAVEMLSVYNFRSCTSAFARAHEKLETTDTLETANEEKIELPAHLPSASTTGELYLPLTNSDSQSWLQMNLIAGKNVLQITYSGECEKKEKGTDGQEVCIHRKELGKKFVLVNADIKRNELPGIRQVDGCQTR